MKIFKFFLILSIAFLSTPLVFAEPKSIYTIQILSSTQIISSTFLERAKNEVEHISHIISLPVRLEKIGGYYVIRAGVAEKPADLMPDLNIIINDGYSQAYLREAYFLKERIIVEARTPFVNKAEAQKVKEEKIHVKAEEQRLKEEDMLAEKNKSSPKLTELTNNKKQRLQFTPIPGEVARDLYAEEAIKPALGKTPERKGMVFIKGGCFKMGDTFGEGGSDEKPVHEVCVNDFYMGEHEVTQGEWKKVMGHNPSYFKDCGDDCPVDNVSLNDVQEYIRKRNGEKESNYRLPTEAEWEYAAREGGGEVRFGTGKDTIGPDEANFDARSDHRQSYSRGGVYIGKTISVKSFSPNALGLYDMTGNVWEWVSDLYKGGYYKNSPRENPKGPDSGDNRVLRGGSWYSLPWAVRAAFRSWAEPVVRGGNFGFRLAQD